MQLEGFAAKELSPKAGDWDDQNANRQ